MSDNFENNTDEYTSEHKKVIKNQHKKLTSGWIVLIVMVAAVALLSVTQIVSSCVNSGGAPTVKKQKSNVPHSMGKYVANLHINGVIEEKNDDYNQEWLINTIDELQKDSNNIGLLLIIDSQGGTVYEADEVYLKLMKYRAEKPVWAYFEHIAASGGYYIGCSAEKIAANRNTLTGSIGVISGRSIDLTELMKKYGIKMTTVTSGRNKNMMNIDSPLTQEQLEIMQALSDECYEQFVGIVSDSRDMNIAKVKSLADGRIYSAKQAKENGLIDEVCSLEEFEESYKVYLDNSKVSFKDLKYEREKKFYEDFFMGKTKNSDQTLEAELLKNLLNSNLNYPAYFYENN